MVIEKLKDYLRERLGVFESFNSPKTSSSYEVNKALIGAYKDALDKISELEAEEKREKAEESVLYVPRDAILNPK